MNKSTLLKGLVAGMTAAVVAGAAIAQSTPPNPAAKDPAVGAGQQSTQSTSMGTTGTPNNAAGPTGSTMGAGASSTTSTGTTASTDTMGMKSKKVARADRN